MMGSESQWLFMLGSLISYIYRLGYQQGMDAARRQA